MYKNRRFFLLVPFLLLSSCQRKNTILVNLPKDESLTYAENDNINSFTTPITTNEIRNKIENSEDFVIFLYSNTCTPCQKIKPFIGQYINNYKYVINSIEAYSESPGTIQEVLNLLYEEERIATPRVYFVAQGKATYIQQGFSSNDYNYKFVEKLFNYYIA